VSFVLREMMLSPDPVQITVELPEDIARHRDPGREALESLALGGYRSHQLTQFDVGQLLGLSRIQAENFLARHVDLYDYSTEELESEADLLRRLRRQVLMLAVSNTSPLRYLIAVGNAELLAGLFGQILIPPGVAEELSDRGAPLAVSR
jgi:hypothetical protein